MRTDYSTQREAIRMAKYVGARRSEDFEIKENHKVVGTLRVKPSGILWAPTRSHGWYGIGIDKLGTYLKEHGTRRKH
jgi:hypothetical protein